MADVAIFSDWILGKFQSVYLILNNAGQANNSYKQTKDGIEWTMGVNHLSHVLLVDRLLNSLEPGSRIVNVASTASLQFDNSSKTITDWTPFFDPTQQTYSFWKAYCYSKLANVWFAKWMQDYLTSKGKQVGSYSLHPGVIRSNFFNRAGTCIDFASKLLYPVVWATFKSVEQGAQTQLYCSTAPLEELRGGEYYSDCSVATKSKAVTPANTNSFMEASLKRLQAAGGPNILKNILPSV